MSPGRSRAAGAGASWPPVLALVSGGALTVDALLAFADGTSTVQNGPAVDPSLLLVAAALGVALCTATLLVRRRRITSDLETVRPRLGPFLGPAPEIGAYLVFVGLAVVIFASLIDTFTGAHAGGTGSGVPDTDRLDGLLIGASVLVWLFLIYLVVALRRVIALGRWLSAREGGDAYGGRAPEGLSFEIPPRWPVASGDTPRPFFGLLGVTTIAALGMAAGVQLLEVGTDPVAPSTWLASQVGVVIVSAAVALSLRAIDRLVRGLERETLVGRGRSDGRAVDHPDPLGGFVP